MRPDNQLPRTTEITKVRPRFFVLFRMDFAINVSVVSCRCRNKATRAATADKKEGEGGEEGGKKNLMWDFVNKGSAAGSAGEASPPPATATPPATSTTC